MAAAFSFGPSALLHEIGERTELRFAGDSGAVLLVGELFGVVLERADRKLGLTAARIDFEDFRFEPCQEAAGESLLF